MVVGVAALLGWRWSPTWEVELAGRVPIHIESHEAAQIEVWLPEPRLLFGGRGRLYHRDQNGALAPQVDPGANYQASWSPEGEVNIRLRFHSWQRPRTCTVAFRNPGAVTRYARQVNLSGWLRLRGRLPPVAPAVTLTGEES